MTKIRFSVCLIICALWGFSQPKPPADFHPDHAGKSAHARPTSREVKALTKDEIAEAIADFKAQTESITRTMIIAEQQRIQDAREHYEDFADEPLQAELIKDEYGVQWRRLSYSDGRIRYEWPDQG
jgi:hypothetical protein